MLGSRCQVRGARMYGRRLRRCTARQLRSISAQPPHLCSVHVQARLAAAARRQGSRALRLPPSRATRSSPCSRPGQQARAGLRSRRSGRRLLPAQQLAQPRQPRRLWMGTGQPLAHSPHSRLGLLATAPRSALSRAGSPQPAAQPQLARLAAQLVQPGRPAVAGASKVLDPQEPPRTSRAPPQQAELEPLVRRRRSRRGWRQPAAWRRLPMGQVISAGTALLQLPGRPQMGPPLCRTMAPHSGRCRLPLLKQQHQIVHTPAAQQVSQPQARVHRRRRLQTQSWRAWTWRSSAGSSATSGWPTRCTSLASSSPSPGSSRPRQTLSTRASAPGTSRPGASCRSPPCSPAASAHPRLYHVLCLCRQQRVCLRLAIRRTLGRFVNACVRMMHACACMLPLGLPGASCT